MWLSLGTTLGGVAFVTIAAAPHWGFSSQDKIAPAVFATIGGLALVVGPSLGHVYSGRLWNPGLNWRLIGVGTAAVGTAVFASAFCVDECHAAGATDAVLIGGITIFVAGALIYAGGTVAEIATAPESALRYSERHAHRTSIGVVPLVTRNMTGLRIAFRF